MAGLAEMLSGWTQDPKVRNFMGNALTDLGYGLTNAPDFGSALGAATRRTADMSGVRLAQEEKSKADQLAANQSNMTRELFAKQAPDLVPLMDAGMPVNELFGEYMRRMQPQGQAEAIRGINMDGRLVNPVTGELIADYSTPTTPSAPSGYRWTPNNTLEAIPGGPAWSDPNAIDPKAEIAAGQRDTATQTITTAAKTARDLANRGMNTGLAGAGFAINPETDAAELRRQIAVLTSNASIENLKAMRAASTSGAALGSVTERENAMLAAAAGALDPNAKKEDFVRALDNYELTLLQIVHGPVAGRQIFEQSRGGAAAMPAQNSPQRTLVYNPATGRLEQQ